MAGFDFVRGVDIDPQPRYCGDEFVQADALEYLSELIQSGEIQQYDAIHASPPCQVNLKGLNAANQARGRELNHADLIDSTRELLQATALPYVIENVEGASLQNAVRLCGSAFNLKVRRHRYFESNILLFGTDCDHSIWSAAIYPTNFRPGGRVATSRVVQVYGNTGGSHLWPEAMQIDWMNRQELQEAIPPAYTEYIGRQLLSTTPAPAPASDAATQEDAHDNR